MRNTPLFEHVPVVKLLCLNILDADAVDVNNSEASICSLTSEGS